MFSDDINLRLNLPNQAVRLIVGDLVFENVVLDLAKRRYAGSLFKALRQLSRK